MSWTAYLGPLGQLIDLGGPVVALLALMSVGALTVILWKLWQFRAAGVGRHDALTEALKEWDAGRRTRAAAALMPSPSHLRPVIAAAMAADGSRAAAERTEAQAETMLAQLEAGFRLLDSIAQTAPLLGLFGTVLGMIEAFQTLQGAGAAVDPALLAGGIWVALLTTAVGLGVAMPTGLALTWFEAKVEAERLWLSAALARIRAPSAPATLPPQPAVPHAAPAPATPHAD